MFVTEISVLKSWPTIASFGLVLQTFNTEHGAQIEHPVGPAGT